MLKNYLSQQGMRVMKQKGHCYLSLLYSNSASFFKNDSRHAYGDGADRLVHNVILGKNVNIAVFGSDFMK